jgi:hypothetical protein
VIIAPPLAPQVQVARRVASRTAAGTLFLFCLVSSLALVTEQLPDLSRLSEVGYGDSYILYDVLHFQHTGRIYRDLSQPPYLPAQYSPLVYMLYSLPGRIGAGEKNLFLGPRLIALAMFLLCVGVVVSIVRTLIRVRFAWLWGMLLAGSISSVRSWVLMLRGDFPAIFFSLLAIRLLLVRSRWAVILAGVCAGFATQFKFTYVAALTAGSLYLLIRRRWKDLGGFAVAGALSSVGLYLLFWMRERDMLAQMLALSPGIVDVKGDIKLVFAALREPVVLIALAGLPPIARRFSPRWGLVLLFTLTSLTIGGLAGLQAGANRNYFFESLLALTPLAVLGVFRLTVWAREHVWAAFFVAGLFAIHFLPTSAHELYLDLPSGIRSRSIESRNEGFRTMQNALQGRHIFSTVPRLALLDPDPALMEPFLLSYLQTLGKFDARPILDRVDSGEFDVLITSVHPEVYRGVPFITRDLRGAIVASYTPYCVLLGFEIYLPRYRPEDKTLVRNLEQISCVPVSSNEPGAVPN